jgi:hypothetical protein
MKLYLILSKSNRQLVPKAEVPDLTPAHRDYHSPMIEQDAVLMKAMIRPDEKTPKGSRCMILQAEGPQEVEDFLMRNPLVRYGAMDWQVQELLPNYGTDALHQWFKGKFSAGHQLANGRPENERRGSEEPQSSPGVTSSSEGE